MKQSDWSKLVARLAMFNHLALFHFSIVDISSWVDTIIIRALYYKSSSSLSIKFYNLKLTKL